MSTTHSGFMIQTNNLNGHGVRGNFELVMPNPTGGGITRYWRDNDSSGLDWNWSNVYDSVPDEVVGPCLIQQDTEGQGLMAVGCVGNHLVDFWRPGYDFPPREFASGVIGNPALIQAGVYPNATFEVVVPRADGGLAHYTRLSYRAWQDPVVFGMEVGRVDAVALIQSNYGTGDLQVVARVGDTLIHFSRGSNGVWSVLRDSQVFFTGASGIPGFIQSQGQNGGRGDFQVVTPLVGGGMKHLRRDNDNPDHPWIISPDTFGSGSVEAVALIQSNFGRDHFGNLEVAARSAGCFELYYSTGIAQIRPNKNNRNRHIHWSEWYGPTVRQCIPQTFQVLDPPPFTHRGQYDGSGDRLYVQLVFNKPVKTGTVIPGNTLILRTPTGYVAEIRDLSWSSDKKMLTFSSAAALSILTERGPVRLTLKGSLPNVLRPDRIYTVEDSAGETLDGDRDGLSGGDYWVDYMPIAG